MQGDQQKTAYAFLHFYFKSTHRFFSKSFISVLAIFLYYRYYLPEIDLIYFFMSSFVLNHAPLIFVAGNMPLLAKKLRYSCEYDVFLAKSLSDNSSFFCVVFAKELVYLINDSSALNAMKSANIFKFPKCAFSKHSKYFFLSFALII